MKCLIALAVIAAIFLPATVFAETIVLQDRNIIYGFYKADLPQQLWQDHCDRYAFMTPDYTAMKNGRYITDKGSVFLLENNCFFPLQGEAALKSGQRVYFFSTDAFRTNGDRAYSAERNGYIPLKNGAYLLQNGDQFAVNDGFIANFGEFNGKNIEYPDRD